MEFDDWLVLHQKSYNCPHELERRRDIFAQNAMVVAQHNDAYEAGYTLYQMTMASPFADMTNEEFSQSYLMEPQHCSATTTTTTNNNKTKKPSLRDIATTVFQTTTLEMTDKDYHVDWRTQGIMTPIKNQANCGSCWTFSTTGCLEAHTCLAHRELDCTSWPGLSEQQLVDCADEYNNHGCNGGLPSQAFEYIKYNIGGLASEHDYPYHGNETGQCLLDETDGIGIGQVAGVYNISSFDETDLEFAIAKIGPLSVAYQVTSDFRFYSNGIYDSYNATTPNHVNCQLSPKKVNHAVVAVGLGTQIIYSNNNNNNQKDVPYYILRNSWGVNWGMEGHFWMKRGENLCGISDCASFPIVPRRNHLAITETTSSAMTTSRNLRNKNNKNKNA